MGDRTNSAPIVTPTLRPTLWVYFALTVQTAISAGTFLVAKRAMAEVDPLTLLIARFLLSGLIFCAILWLTPGARLPPRRTWKTILVLGFLAGPLNQVMFFFGLSRSVPAHAALLYALTPLGVYVYGLLRGKERVSIKIVVGIALALLGVLVLLLGRGLRAAAGPLLGDLLILIAVIAWVLYTAEGKALISEHGPLRSAAWTMTMGSLYILPLSFFFFDVRSIAVSSLAVQLGILYLALLTSVVAYLLWYFALSRMTASKVAIFANLQPVATAVAAWALLGDKLTWEIAVGGALVLMGVRAAQTG